MKHFLCLSLLVASHWAFASMEHRPGLGVKPKPEKLSRARGCFKEIRNLGCGHPREDQAHFNTCLLDKEADLSPGCQSFFQKLYGKR